MGHAEQKEQFGREEAFHEIVYMLEKFQLLIKAYYSLFEAME